MALPVPYAFRFRLPAVILNPRLSRLQPCSFEQLRQWFADVRPNPALVPISLSIGEPRHPTPVVVADALAAGMSGLANYPTTIGPPALRTAIARCASRAFQGRLVAAACALSAVSPGAGPGA